MATYRITVTAQGMSGCDRHVGDGETVEGCGRQDCADCAARRLIANLRSISGTIIAQASIEHFLPAPDDGSEAEPGSGRVLDDLVGRRRVGTFPDRADAAHAVKVAAGIVDARLTEEIAAREKAEADRTVAEQRAQAAEAELAALKAPAKPSA